MYEIETIITKTYGKNIWRKFIKAVESYKLIEDGDKIAVCISGGKDSMLLAKLILMAAEHGLYDVKPFFIMMDAGFNEENLDNIKENAKLLKIPLEIFKTDVFDNVDEINESPCFFCSRMRRGFLYRKAKELGCNKIALGHHYDDVVETTLMGMLYGAQIQTMLPKLKSDNVEDMELIRPMYLIHEEDICAWRDTVKMKFVKCACRLKNDGENELTTRFKVKKLIEELNRENNAVKNNIFGSVQNVNLKKILGYQINGIHHDFTENY